MSEVYVVIRNVTYGLHHNGTVIGVTESEDGAKLMMDVDDTDYCAPDYYTRISHTLHKCQVRP